MKRIILLLATLATLASLAHSDVTVVRHLKVQSLTGGGSVSAQSIMQVHGQKSRREMQVLVEGNLAKDFHYPLQTITMVSLSKGTVHAWRFPDVGYEKISLSKWRKYLTDTSGSELSAYQINQSWSRVVPEEETKTIKGVPCSKFGFEWHFQIQDPETYARKEFTVKTTLWLADLSPALEQVLREERAFQQIYHKRIGGAPLEDLNKLTMQFAEEKTGMDKNELFEALNQGTARLKKIHGYPMATETTWYLVGSKTNKPLFKVSSELDSLSQKPLAESQFQPSTQSFTPQFDEADLNAKLITRTN